MNIGFSLMLTIGLWSYAEWKITKIRRNIQIKKVLGSAVFFCLRPVFKEFNLNIIHARPLTTTINQYFKFY